MRTKLLKRLRRKADNSFYIEVLENSHVGVIYRIVRSGFIEEWLGEFDNKDKVMEMLETFKRKFIKNKIDIIRFYER